jgi:hypothetical protein
MIIKVKDRPSEEPASPEKSFSRTTDITVCLKVRTTTNELPRILAYIEQVQNTELVSKRIGLNWIRGVGFSSDHDAEGAL